ncbi:MAG: peptidylprolyl isomerase [Clostridium sp.]|nr:peptidylprolyl isomerase [Clostridium sp.]
MRKLALSIAMAILLAACGKEKKAVPSDALAVVEDAALTRTELLRNFPAGLSAEDSAKYARAFIRQWIDDRMMATIASKEIDLTEIDNMVEQYRNELIAFEYSKRMYQTHAPELDADTIEAYYNAHKDEFVLALPMVKGVYLKVASDAPELPTLRRLYRSDKPADIDKLEKSALSSAVHYDYFRDRWVNWSQVESRIPYDFSPSPDAFLYQIPRHIEFEQGGFTYLLLVTEALHTGQKMPLEAAEPLIKERLTFAGQRQYMGQLKRELLENAISEGKIAIFCELGL